MAEVRAKRASNPGETSSSRKPPTRVASAFQPNADGDPNTERNPAPAQPAPLNRSEPESRHQAMSDDYVPTEAASPTGLVARRRGASHLDHRRAPRTSTTEGRTAPPHPAPRSEDGLPAGDAQDRARDVGRVPR
ncbi:hypothetical protein GCM10022215_12650 [Nocardioides fonticola]|uniref:Uncharacterized protein n=1 Tax=Nocardioides fonticola TaxID=450363 RepID=A0ABP7XFX9_9ACTN